MPNARLTDRGAGQPVTVSWTSIDHSPFGKVTSYRCCHGTHTGQYTDSLRQTAQRQQSRDSTETEHTSLPFGRLTTRAISAHCRMSCQTLPTPRGLTAVNHQRTIELQWYANTDADLAGYNVYRHSTNDTVVRKLTGALLTKPTYLDSAVWGNQTYD